MPFHFGYTKRTFLYRKEYERKRSDADIRQGKEKHCFSGVFPYNMERYRVDNRSVADSSARTLLQNKTDC